MDAIYRDGQATESRRCKHDPLEQASQSAIGTLVAGFRPSIPASARTAIQAQPKALREFGCFGLDRPGFCTASRSSNERHHEGLNLSGLLLRLRYAHDTNTSVETRKCLDATHAKPIGRMTP